MRSRLLGCVVSVLLACCAGSVAQAQQVGGWEIGRADDNCRMFASFDGDILIAFLWFPTTQEHRLMLLNEKWDSLAARNAEEVRLFMKLTGEAVEYDEWWDDGAMIVALDNGTEGVVASWGKEHATDFAVSFALATSARLEIDGRSLGSFDMEGTYEALLALKKCGAELINKIDDPFAI